MYIFFPYFIMINCTHIRDEEGEYEYLNKRTMYIYLYVFIFIYFSNI